MSCKDNKSELEKMKMELELQKAKEATAKAEREIEIQKKEAENLKQKNELLKEQQKTKSQLVSNTQFDVTSSTVRVVLDEIDDIAFVGICTQNQVNNRELPISFTAQYNTGSYSNGSRTNYVEDDIPNGISYMAVGLYNWVWTGFGKGKYQYDIRVDIDGEPILRQSSGGRVNDNTAGMKYFTVIELNKDRNGKITTSSTVDNKIKAQLKNTYSRIMQSRNNR